MSQNYIFGLIYWFYTQYNRSMNRAKTALGRGVVTASALASALGVSRQTLMRLVREASPDVVAIGRARATRYGLRQIWPSLDGSRFPLFRVDRDGSAQADGHLFTLASQQTVWQPQGAVNDGLPIEIADMRPSGFLGRLFAAGHRDLPVPLRVDDWSDHHVLIALSRRGEDMPGNLLIGDESFARWQAMELSPRTRDDYPQLATATLAGDPPGSSAGGERPRFDYPAPPPAAARTIYLVDKPSAAQSVFQLGHPGPNRYTPDYYALQVMNTLLGGLFQSRLNHNIREEKGYSYGVGSGFSYGRGPGAFGDWSRRRLAATAMC